MPSGKKSKQMRRAAVPPPVVSKGGGRNGGRPRSGGGLAGARRANPRVLAAIAGVVVLAVIGIVLGVVFSGGSSFSASSYPTVGSVNSDAALPDATDVEQMFKGIPQSGTTLGSAFAPVTMVEYIDLQCPICQEFETTVMPDILDKYVRAKKVKVIVKPWAFIGPDSVRGQKAMLAAAKQNKAFNFAQLLYDNQGTENTGWLTDAMVAQAASSIPGLEVHQLLDERNSSTVAQEADAVAAAAEADNVSGTPSVYVGKSGKKGSYVALQNGGDEQSLVSALDSALKQ